MEVIVPDDFLSIAIGKKGQNVRLASKLSGWHLDVKSETRYSQAMQSGYDSLVALPGVGISLADALYEAGLYSAGELSHASAEDLIQIRGIGEEKAKKLIEAAKLSLEAKEAADASMVDAEDQETRADEVDADAEPLGTQTGQADADAESSENNIDETGADADDQDTPIVEATDDAEVSEQQLDESTARAATDETATDKAK